MATDNNTPTYIARCKCGCGGIVFATVDNPNHATDVAKDVAEAIRDGYAVERSTAAVVRSEPFGCQTRQPALRDYWMRDHSRPGGVRPRFEGGDLTTT